MVMAGELGAVIKGHGLPPRLGQGRQQHGQSVGNGARGLAGRPGSQQQAGVALVKGEHALQPAVPESFNVLVKELQGLGLDVRLEHKQHLVTAAELFDKLVKRELEEGVSVRTGGSRNEAAEVAAVRERLLKSAEVRKP